MGEQEQSLAEGVRAMLRDTRPWLVAPVPCLWATARGSSPLIRMRAYRVPVIEKRVSSDSWPGPGSPSGHEASPWLATPSLARPPGRKGCLSPVVWGGVGAGGGGESWGGGVWLPPRSGSSLAELPVCRFVGLGTERACQGRFQTWAETGLFIQLRASGLEVSSPWVAPRGGAKRRG